MLTPRTCARAHAHLHRHRAILLVSCLSLVLVCVARPWRMVAAQGASDPAPATQSKHAAEFVPGEILVRFRSDSPALAAKGARQSLTVRAAGRAVPVEVEDFGGSEIVEGLRLARVAAADTEATVEALNARADVLYAEPNYIRRKTVAPSDARYAEQWGLHNTGQIVSGFSGGVAGADVKAEQAWDVTRGSRAVVVGVVDEGVDISHQDLVANVWTNPGDDADRGFAGDAHGWDFVHNDASVYDAGTNPDGTQTDAHGTHVAGIVGATGDNGVGVAGVNWQVSLLPIKVLGPEGGNDADIIRGYAYAKMLRDLWDATNGARGANIRALNNSYGGAGFSQSALDAVRALDASGILFVAAAGNDASNADHVPQYPADYDAPNVISVAATAQNDGLAYFSNYGAHRVALAAPGSVILSTTPNNTYSFYNGTSMAAPFVTGAAALLCAARPAITVAQERAALVLNGDVLPALAGKTYSGRRLNIAAALQSAAEGDTTAPAPAANLTADGAGRAKTLHWIAPGDDGNAGRASLYEINFVDAATDATFPLATQLPAAAGAQETAIVSVPFQHASGSIIVKTFDNAGNASSASVAVAVNSDAAPYVVTEGDAGQVSSGGSPLNLRADDNYREFYLPFDFTLYDKTYGALSSIYVSTNGALYFSLPPRDGNGAPTDGFSSVYELNGLPMIAGLWDDLRTDRRAGDDVYFSQPTPDQLIFRWQAVTYDSLLPDGTHRGENPVNFEIELDRDGTIITRYGDGNQRVTPVVGVSQGEPDAYLSASHTAEFGHAPISLAGAPSVAFRQHGYAIKGHLALDPTLNSGDRSRIQIKLTGARTRSTRPDANGDYSFYTLPAGGDFTVAPFFDTTNTPRRAVFTPPSQTFNNLSADQRADFAARLAAYSVRGRVVDAHGNGVAGVDVTITAGLGTRTDASGNYVFNNIPAGQGYAVGALSNNDYRFAIQQQSIPDLEGDVTLPDFVATALYTISGRVVDLTGKGVAGVTLKTDTEFGFTTADTDANGNYKFVLTGGRAYTVTASLMSYNISPGSQTVASLDASRTLADFVARRLYTIQGYARDAAGNGISGATVSLTGAAMQTVQTAANGGYYFGNFPEGASYTVTISKPYYTFDQPSITYANLNAHQTSVFVGTLAANTILGRITDANGQGIAAITLALSGASQATTQTDAAGYYVFGDLASGASYAVTPSPDAYTFAPASLAFDNFAGNARNANFVATPKSNLRIDGSIDDGAGHAVVGVAVNLTGPLNQFGVPSYSASTTTGAGGLFSFANLTAGTRYTVTPVGDAFNGFAPFSTTVTLAASATMHFTATGLRVQPASIQFSPNNLLAGESVGSVLISVVRAGDTSSAVSVDYATVDDPSPVRCDDTTTKPGVAFARCDYATTVGTLTFAPGQIIKNISVPIIDDAFVEPNESFQMKLSNAVGAPLGALSTLTIPIFDNDTPGLANPLNNPDFFVRMQYLDFLSREPEVGQPWSNVLAQCRANDTSCDRVAVSANFFRSQEFQLKGLFVFKFYKVAFGRLPLYSEIIPDMASVTGTTTSEVQAKKAAFADGWSRRQSFHDAGLDALSDAAFVNALMDRYSLPSITTPNPATPDDASSKLTLTRADLTSRLNAASMTRGQVVRAVADSDEVSAAEFNSAFVAMQYFGYLRRDPDAGGYNAWLQTINANPADFRTMVNGFVNSTEYRLRFGQP